MVIAMPPPHRLLNALGTTLLRLFSIFAAEHLAKHTADAALALLLLHIESRAGSRCTLRSRSERRRWRMRPWLKDTVPLSSRSAISRMHAQRRPQWRPCWVLIVEFQFLACVVLVPAYCFHSRLFSAILHP